MVWPASGAWVPRPTVYDALFFPGRGFTTLHVLPLQERQIRALVERRLVSMCMSEEAVQRVAERAADPQCRA